MSYGSPILRQHIVEFKVGTGLVTDGVVDATSTSGPWTWTVPDGVASITLGMTNAGAGGCGGGNGSGAISVGGGGGGAGGYCFNAPFVAVTPKSTLTITIAAGGAGGAIGAAGGTPGNTSVAGLPIAFSQNVSGRVLLTNTAGNPTAGTAGGSSPTTFAAGGNAGSPTGNGGATAGAAGSMGTYVTSRIYPLGVDAIIFNWGGSGGCAGAATGSVAGGGNTFVARSFITLGGTNLEQTVNPSGGTGNTTGTLSRGAGGAGGHSLFGFGAPGANGGAAGTAPTYGFGGGGSGGGGDAAGGNGAPGFVAITYWSVD